MWKPFMYTDNMMKKISGVAFAALAWAMVTSCSPGKKEAAGEGLYAERFRPQFHFSPEKSWMNDPNGMVWFDGEYHLFYQYYPDSNVWGPMHWGHAVSPDMIRWEHLPIALYPDSLGYIFSGSAVVDYYNTSGLGSPQQPAMVAIFTYHRPDADKTNSNDFQNQGLAYSLDHGRTWKKYDKNPILRKLGERDFRDPKVFWDDTYSKWFMILAVKDHVELYGSDNLREWSYLSRFGETVGAHGGVWECPDLFEIEIKGSREKKWVMLVNINPGAINGGSGTQYFIGKFDGTEFKPESKETLWLDFGKDNYAGVTWSTPAAEKRKLFLGWMSNWQYGQAVPTTKWRSAMTVPRVLSLLPTEQGLRLGSNPVSEVRTLREGPPAEYTDVLAFSDSTSAEISLPGSQLEVVMEIDRESNQKDFEIVLENKSGEKLLVGLRSDSNQLYVDRTKSGQSGFSPEFPGTHAGQRSFTSRDIKLTLILDAASIEVFADDGTTCITDIFFPVAPYSTLKVNAPGSGVAVRLLQVAALKSIWNTNGRVR